MELVGLLFGFWLFVFSKLFRESWIYEFKSSNFIFKVFQLTGAILSAVVTFILPIGYLIWLVVFA